MSVEHIPIQSREQWLELRKQDITASVCGCLFGVHPYQTVAGLHAEKTGLDIPGPDPESAVIRRGNALEAVVAAEVAKLRPEWLIVKADVYLRDPLARIGATPDFLIKGDPRGLGVLQCKTVAAWKFKKEWAGADGPTAPTAIILQTAVEMMLADAAFGAIGVLVIGDYEFSTHVIEVPRHKPTEHKIRVAVNAFWQAIEAGQAPELDYARDGELIKSMYRTTEPGKVVDLRGDNRIIELLETRQQQVEYEKAAVKVREEAEAEIRAKLGDAEFALVNGWRVTFKSHSRREHVVPAKTVRVLRAQRGNGNV